MKRCTKTEYDDRYEKMALALELAIGRSLEDIGITAGSTLWYVKKEQAKDYLKEELVKLFDRPKKKGKV